MRRPRGRHGAGCGRARRHGGRRRHARAGHGGRREPDRPVSGRPPRDPGAARPAQGQEGALADPVRRRREQPAAGRCRHPARHLHLHHRRLRQRQVEPGGRHAVPGARPAPAPGAPAGRRARSDRGHRVPRQGGRHRPVADRPHAALQSRDLHRLLHAAARLVRRACPRPRRAATGPAASRSTSRAGAARPARATA